MVFLSCKRNFIHLTAMLSQNEANNDRKFLREIWLEEQNVTYPWTHIDGLPGCIGSDIHVYIKRVGWGVSRLACKQT